jgi:hypothetical protein
MNGGDAWQSFKARRVGFSFAYMTIAATGRKDGGRRITELDVFEITATRVPMNNDTRVLSTKALDIVELADADALADVGREWADLMTKAMGGKADPAASLRAKSERLARELAPVQIASYEC